MGIGEQNHPRGTGYKGGWSTAAWVQLEDPWKNVCILFSLADKIQKHITMQPLLLTIVIVEFFNIL